MKPHFPWIEKSEIGERCHVASLSAIGHYGTDSFMEDRLNELDIAEYLKDESRNARQVLVSEQNWHNAFFGILFAAFILGGTVGLLLARKKAVLKCEWCGAEVAPAMPSSSLDGFSGERAAVRGLRL